MDKCTFQGIQNASLGDVSSYSLPANHCWHHLHGYHLGIFPCFYTEDSLFFSSSRINQHIDEVIYSVVIFQTNYVSQMVVMILWCSVRDIHPHLLEDKTQEGLE